MAEHACRYGPPGAGWLDRAGFEGMLRHQLAACATRGLSKSLHHCAHAEAAAAAAGGHGGGGGVSGEYGPVCGVLKRLLLKPPRRNVPKLVHLSEGAALSGAMGAALAGPLQRLEDRLVARLAPLLCPRDADAAVLRQPPQAPPADVACIGAAAHPLPPAPPQGPSMAPPSRRADSEAPAAAVTASPSAELLSPGPGRTTPLLREGGMRARGREGAPAAPVAAKEGSARFLSESSFASESALRSESGPLNSPPPFGLPLAAQAAPPPSDFRGAVVPELTSKYQPVFTSTQGHAQNLPPQAVAVAAAMAAARRRRLAMLQDVEPGEFRAPSAFSIRASQARGRKGQ